MSDHLPQLEQLLDQLGSNEMPGDTGHRYALRRALLHSPIFEANRRVLWWFHMFTVTGSAIAGGFVVAVVIVSVGVTGSSPPRGGSISSGPVGLNAVQVADAEGGFQVDFSDFVTKENVDKWVALPNSFVVSR